jgi:DNA-binding transcriptional LysR family regulator
MSLDLDLHTVRIIRAIADHGSITAAAAQLGFSQPALSQHLRRAERRLGVPLLLRTGRGVQLTEPGRVIARHSTIVLAALTAAQDELGHLADRTTGTVRMAGFPSASSTIVPAMMAQLNAQHPGLELIYTEAEPPESLAMLAEGSIDLALTFSFPGDPDDPHQGLVAMSVMELFSDPTVLVLPSEYPATEDPRAGLADFDHATWIGGCPVCRGHLLASCRAQGFSPRIVHATDNSVAVLGLVAAGVGIAMQPMLALAPLDLPAGTALRDLPDNDRKVRLVSLNGAAAVPAIGATIDAIDAVTAPRR